MPKIESLIRSHLRRVETYSPVDPSAELARQAGIPPEDVIRLNANENPFGPTPRVQEKMPSAPVHLYPDPLQREIRAALAEYAGMPMQHILAGAGSDELIDLLMRLFVEPGERVLDCEPTFGMYSFCARVAAAEVVSVPRDGAFDVAPAEVAEQDDGRTKILFLASPNNPTGNLLPEATARELLKLNLVLVVDETYFEFCGETLAHLVPEYDNLVVLRSFSKWAGLAGIRVGYMVGSPAIVSHLIDIKQPYSVSAVAEAAALASLEERGSLMDNVRVLVEQRRRLEKTLDEIDEVSYRPSWGNFLLCEFDRPAKEVYEGLASYGVFVRMFSHPRLTHALRISSGTPEQTDRLIEAVREVV